jgi:adenine-specific DNA-methyltransferase
VTPTQAIEELVAKVRSAMTEDVPSARAAFETELRRVRAEAELSPDDWSAWADGADVIGTAYETLVSGADRRAKGQFQTPFWAADLMAAWLLQHQPKLVMDPGVGAGRLLFRTARHAGTDIPELLGFDIDPICLAMADVNLRLRGAQAFKLAERNFMIDQVPERPDGLICNPPYSRHHAIPADQKAALHAGIEERLDLRLSRLAALHVLFLVRALEVVQDGGHIAFITPADWLDVNYGRKVKQYVLEHANVEAIVLFDDDHLFFDGALTSAAITLLRKKTGGGGSTRVIRLPAELPPVDDVLKAINGSPGKLAVTEVALSDSVKWSRPTGIVAEGTPLRELARIRRGIATGCNKFFVISEARRRELGLDEDDLKRCITGPKLVEGTELTNQDLEALPDTTPRWALECRAPQAEEGDDAIGRYLRWGMEELQAHTGYLARSRKPWYALEQRSNVAILFTYMNRQRPRFIRNSAGAVPLNTFLIVEPNDGVDPDALCDALNAPETLAQLEQLRRNYGGGLWKLEPSEVASLQVSL